MRCGEVMRAWVRFPPRAFFFFFFFCCTLFSMILLMGWEYHWVASRGSNPSSFAYFSKNSLLVSMSLQEPVVVNIKN